MKVWGRDAPRPEGDLRRFYELAMPGIEPADVAIEVSTAGLRKPVGEIYPDAEFLRMCLDLGKPVALSSDAHVPEDLGHGYDQAVEFLRELGVDRARRLRGPPAHDGAAGMSTRTGIAYDSHRLDAGAPAGAGGVQMPSAARGLTGHSDADVLTHAVIDALLGAGGLGDIGHHFPDTDPRCKDADSIELLGQVRPAAGRRGPARRPRGRHRGRRGAQARPAPRRDARAAGRRPGRAPSAR